MQSFQDVDSATETLEKVALHRRTLSSCESNLSTSRKTSAQTLWAEDYYDTTDINIDMNNGRVSHFHDDSESNTKRLRETEYQNSFEDIDITQPAQPRLTEQPFLSSDNGGLEQRVSPRERQPRTHQRSLTSILPFNISLPRPLESLRTGASSPTRSPVKECSNDGEDAYFMSTLTGDKSCTVKFEGKPSRGLAGWFSGTSNSIAVGVPVDNISINEPPLEERRPSVPSTPTSSPAKLRKMATNSTTTPDSSLSPLHLRTPPGTKSVFSFFTSPKTPTKAAPHPTDAYRDDEFLTLDIHASLFPAGTIDPFSPASFKNLLTNAEGLLSRLQTAYKQRVAHLREIAAESEAQRDELEEAETRAQHLKQQLADMAARVEEQDGTLKSILEELMAEKQARAEEREARTRSIVLIRAGKVAEMPAVPNAPDAESDGRQRRPSEDLEVDAGTLRRKYKRDSRDSVFESDESSAETESVFSRCISPESGISSISGSSAISTPEVAQAAFGKVHSRNSVIPGAGLDFSGPPPPVRRKSVFERTLSAARGEVDEVEKEAVAPYLCENCEGKDSGSAWKAVKGLRDENKDLKRKVGELEGVVESTLDFMRGIGL
jgi:hypothetical protein